MRSDEKSIVIISLIEPKGFVINSDFGMSFSILFSGVDTVFIEKFELD